MRYALANNITAVTRDRFTLTLAERDLVRQAGVLARQLATAAWIQTREAMNLMTTPGSDLYHLGTTFLRELQQKFAIPSVNLDTLLKPTLAYVHRNYCSIAHGLDGQITLVDVDLGTQVSNFFTGALFGSVTCGYVRGGNRVRDGAALEAPGRMHIDFRRLANTAEVARTIVHEASHKYCGTGDPAYSPSWATLTSANAKDNADSYAYFAAVPNLSHRR